MTTVAERFGLSKDAVRRHNAAHVSPALARVAAKHAEAGPWSALERCEELYRRAARVLDAAEAEGRSALTLSAVRELRSCTELLARLTGELDERAQVAVVNLAESPDWLALRGAIVGALRPHPEALRDVERALLPVGEAS